MPICFLFTLRTSTTLRVNSRKEQEETRTLKIIFAITFLDTRKVTKEYAL